jgi:hypothetical protein
MTTHDALPDIVGISFNLHYSAAEARAELAAAGEEITKNSIINKMLGWAQIDITKNDVLVLFTDPLTGDEVHFPQDSQF